MAHYYRICATCREVNKPCEHETILAGSRWSAPRKTNDKAWAKIAAGNIWWNERRIQRPARTMPTAEEVEESARRQHEHTKRWRETRLERLALHKERVRQWLIDNGVPVPDIDTRSNRRRDTKNRRNK